MPVVGFHEDYVGSQQSLPQPQFGEPYKIPLGGGRDAEIRSCQKASPPRPAKLPTTAEPESAPVHCSVKQKLMQQDRPNVRGYKR
jgi:hypothetical protein